MLVHLLVNPVERDTFRRIDFHGDDELLPLGFCSRCRFRVRASRCVSRTLRAVLPLPDAALRAPRDGKLFHRLGHGADVFRRCAAASAENPYAERCGILREVREIFRRRSRIDGAIAHAPRKADIGHRAARNRAVPRESSSSIGSSDCGPSVQFVPIDLDVRGRESRGSIRRTRAAIGGAIFGKSHLRDDRQIGKCREWLRWR